MHLSEKGISWGEITLCSSIWVTVYLQIINPKLTKFNKLGVNTRKLHNAIDL